MEIFTSGVYLENCKGRMDKLRLLAEFNNPDLSDKILIVTESYNPTVLAEDVTKEEFPEKLTKKRGKGFCYLF